MRLRRRYAVCAAALGVLLAAVPAVDGSEPPAVSAVNVGAYSHYWSPPQTMTIAGGTVTIRNSTAVAHGVEWVGGPAKPECSSGVPVGTTPAASGTQWSGTCTFTKAGTYTFYCTVHGPEMTGTITITTPGAPITATGGADSLGLTEATLSGTVDRQGKATSYYFNYGTSASYGQKTSEVPAAEVSGAQAVSAQLSSLSPDTTYHYQLVAKNAAATTEGVDRTFTTLSPPGAPSATTGLATALTETAATLNGTVDPDGLATTYLFEWGTSSSYGNTTEVLSAGADHASHAESAVLSDLTAGTVYHFRLLAKNASGTTPGTDRTFTTSVPPAPPSPAPTITTRLTPTPLPQAVPAAVTTTPGTVELPLGSPLEGAVALRSSQQGTTVKGSLDVSAAGAGGRLEVDLLAKEASIAKAKPSLVLVGRLVRSVVAAGRASFAVKLDAKARAALRRHHRLALSVRVTLAPTRGQPVTVAHSVVLNG
jgi:plastocyanin